MNRRSVLYLHDGHWPSRPAAVVNARAADGTPVVLDETHAAGA